MGDVYNDSEECVCGEPDCIMCPNENCLEGLACPDCGSVGPFDIHARCIVRMGDQGSEYAIDFDWEDHDHAGCPNCGYGGPVCSYRLDRVIPSRHPFV